MHALDICKGNIEGEVFMDGTQHRLYSNGNCNIHFNFEGSNAETGLVIELDQVENCDKMKGECIFSGKYVKENK